MYYMYIPHLYTRVVQFLVHSHPPSINAREKFGNTPLHLASLHGRTEVARFLIKEGAKVDIRWGILGITFAYMLG